MEGGGREGKRTRKKSARAGRECSNIISSNSNSSNMGFMWFVACELCSVYLTSLDLDLDLGLDLGGWMGAGGLIMNTRKSAERKREGDGEGRREAQPSVGRLPICLSTPFHQSVRPSGICENARVRGNTHDDDTDTRNTAYVTKGIGENGGTV
jgi:hypothetical protein